MKSFKFFPLLCLLASLLLSCDRDATTSVSDGSWTASFRVASSLTDSQLSRATWVYVQASRSGMVVASDSALYTAHSVTLTIPSAGAVDIRLTGLNSNEDTVMWTGAGTIDDGVANPGNVVTLVAGPGLSASSTASSTTSSWSDTGHFTDSRDGQAYKYVKIGKQTWMAQNLNYAGSSGSVGVCYNGVPSNCTTYGRLYTWSEVMAGSSSSTSIPSGVQGICPSGWHVPSDAEWSALVQYVDSATSGTKLKSTSGWSNSGNGTNAYGFNVLPAGYRQNVGPFNALGDIAYFCSSSEDAASNAWYWNFYCDYAYVSRNGSNKSDGFSLRCAQN